MEVHIVNRHNEHLYRHETERDQRHRHEVFVERMGWESLRRPDRHEHDAYDNADTTHLLVLRGGEVVGGMRLTQLDRPNLLLDHFKHLVQRPLPGTETRGADWTRFYTIGKPERIGPSSAAAALYCSAMEYALVRGWEYLTFVSKPAMIEILLSIGWSVTPLGMPQMVEGDPTIAAYIKVDEDSLFHARVFAGLYGSLLCDRQADVAATGWLGINGRRMVH